MVHSTRRFVLCLTLYYFVLVFFSPLSIAITIVAERANLSAFCTFVRFALVWFCLFPLPLDVWEGLRFVIVELPGLFFYLCFYFSLFILSLAGRDILIAPRILDCFLFLYKIVIYYVMIIISKTRLFRYVENFTDKN